MTAPPPPPEPPTTQPAAESTIASENGRITLNFIIVLPSVAGGTTFLSHVLARGGGRHPSAAADYHTRFEPLNSMKIDDIVGHRRVGLGSQFDEGVPFAHRRIAPSTARRAPNLALWRVPKPCPVACAQTLPCGVCPNFALWRVPKPCPVARTQSLPCGANPNVALWRVPKVSQLGGTRSAARWRPASRNEEPICTPATRISKSEPVSLAVTTKSCTLGSESRVRRGLARAGPCRAQWRRDCG